MRWWWPSTRDARPCRRCRDCCLIGSVDMATRWSRCSGRRPQVERQDRRLPGQLRPLHERTPRRRRASARDLRPPHRRGGGEPGKAPAAFQRRGTGAPHPGRSQGPRPGGGRDLHRPDCRICPLTESEHAREGAARLLRLRRGAAAGAHEQEARARHPHGLSYVGLRPHLRFVKYLEGHRELWRERVGPGAACRRQSAEGEVQIKVDELLDRFEYLIQNARHVPLSTQVMVNEDEIMELIDQLRFNLPDEIKQANWTVSEQQRIITEAHAEAARIMSRANERAEETSSDHEIVRRAERQGTQVVRDAQSKSDQIIRDAEAYALEQLVQLEQHLSRTLATVKRGVEALQSSNTEQDGAGAPEPEEAAR